MEKRKNGFLRRRLQIDQKVAARDQVHLRERRVLREVVRRKDDELPQVLRNVVAVRRLPEKALAALFIHVLELFIAIETRAGMSQGSGVDVGGKDFDVQLP